MAKISVVIPTRDRADLIGEAISSIINQTFTDFEVIVVDDHSSKDDKTEEVVKELNDNRIKYFKLMDENGIGIASARNFGNVVAKGEFIAVQDSDDVSYPKRLELSLEKINEGYDLVYGEIDHWWPENNKIEKRNNEFSAREFDLEYYKKYNFIPNTTAMYKRQLALDFPYNSFFRKSEDYDFFSRLNQYGFKFGLVNESLVKVRKHDGSISRNSNDLFDYPKVMRENRGW